jgi:hypothetical protein
VAPEIGQGDGADPIDMVLTAAEHGSPVTLQPAGVTQLAAQRPGLAAELPRNYGYVAGSAAGASAAAAGGPKNWQVQVGEYATGKLATHQIDYVADTFKSLFDDREGQVDRIGGSYRAVFTGFTEADAKSACSALAASRIVCTANTR